MNLTDIIAAHTYDVIGRGCYYCGNDPEVSELDHAAHVAAEIEKSLRVEYIARNTNGGGRIVGTYDEADKHARQMWSEHRTPRIDEPRAPDFECIVRRYVTEWEATK